MKKVLALLALALATLPSLALSTQLVGYGGYRIGDSAVLTNATRISVLLFSVTDDLQDNAGKPLSAEKVNGQKIVRWWSYGSIPPITQVPATPTVPAHIQYNNVATNFLADYSPTWHYGTVSYSPVYLVVDYDYITYTLSYNANGGTGSLPSSRSNVIYTNEVVVASDSLPARTGYTWSGWTNNLSTTVWLGDEKVTGESLGLRSIVDGSNVVLRAKWTPNAYLVTLDPCEGTVAPGSVSVTYDAAWPALPTPTREGYYFDGWYNDDRYNTATPTNSTVAITGDATIYAKWTRRLTATFIDPVDSNTQLVYVAYGSTPTAPFTPNHSGYTFSDWSPKLGSITQDTVYTAQFTGTQYFIIYHSNFGDPEETRKIDYVYGTAKAALNGATEFPRAGYTFRGWATSAESTTVRFSAGEGIVTFSDDGNDLYAVWEPITYTIHFDANGGTGEMTDIADVEYDTEVTLPACAFTKSGVEFKNWKCSTETYGDGATVSNLTTTANAIVTFSAVWSEKCYVAFDGNGGEGEMTVQTFDAEELPSALTSNAFTKVGYTFSGWATNETEAAAQTVAYTDGADVASTNLWNGIGETNVFYAVWSNNHYTVHFDANGGTGTMADMALTYDVETNLAIHTFTHASGLSFAGWTNYTDSVGYDDGATVSNLTAEADGEVTLFAVWDVGELSKAMHCNNLEWTSEGSAGMYAGWTTVEGDGIGYDSNSAAVSVLMDEDRTQPLKAKATTGGTLSFKFKVDGDANITWTNANSSVTYSGLNAGTWYSETLEIAAPMEGETKEIFLQYVLSGIAADTVRVYIDQMTWAPAGAEPTEADRPVVSGFTPATVGGFTLSVDSSNVSDSFSYQILATNELVSGDWPVMTNLTSDVIGSGFTIVPEADEPTMFYKVKVIAK